VPRRPLAAASVGRRTALLGLAATALAAGCDHGDDIGDPTGGGTPSTAPSTSEPTASSPPPTADQTLVDEVLADLGAALGVLASARRTPSLRPVVTPIQRAHRHHVQSLDGELPTASDGAGSAFGLDDVHRSERRLQAALVDAAGRAESGALAKLLASISASVTQHLATLPVEAS